MRTSLKKRVEKVEATLVPEKVGQTHLIFLPHGVTSEERELFVEKEIKDRKIDETVDKVLLIRWVEPGDR